VPRPGCQDTTPARLKCSWYVRARLDDKEFKGSADDLAPGIHRVVCMGYSNPIIDTEVEFLPGRSYALRNKRYYPDVMSRADLTWLEDLDSGETLACSGVKPHF